MAIITHRLRALIRKEFSQIRRDRRLLVSLILPPTVQLVLLGFALSATVTNIKLGAVDDSHTPESRELLARLSESEAFRLVGAYGSVDQLGDAISRNSVDAGVVIPHDYSRNLQRDRTATVQVFLNAMNANTATISNAYAQGVIQSYSVTLREQGLHAIDHRIGSASPFRGRPQLHSAYLYNPGLRDSWFIVTGVFGLLLILNSSLVAAATMVKERELGTIEQLLMAPTTTTEIVLAKIAPIFGLLFLTSVLAIGMMKLVFGVPFHGQLPIVLCGAALCILSGISIGTVNATFARSAQQAQLMAFFINPPINATAGALSPVEAMPTWMQPITMINPIHHFAVITRASMLKGSGIIDLWPHFLGLAIITAVLGILSIWRFRKQIA